MIGSRYLELTLNHLSSTISQNSSLEYFGAGGSGLASFDAMMVARQDGVRTGHCWTCTALDRRIYLFGR